MPIISSELTKFINSTDSVDTSTVLYLLHARIAAGLENHESGSENLHTTIDQAWNDAAKYTDAIAEKNPNRAFDLALLLSYLPSGNGPKEQIAGWMRGDGPILLTKENLRNPLQRYLESDPQAGNFVAKMLEYMTYDISGFNKEQAFEKPDCFLTIATMFLGTSMKYLPDNAHATVLYQTAKEKLKNPGVSRIVRYFKELEDTSWIAEALEPYLDQSTHKIK